MAVIRTDQLIRKELENEKFKGISFIDHSNLDKNEFLYDSKHFRINSGVKILATNIKKATQSGKADNIRTKTIRPNMKPNRHQPNTNGEHLNEINQNKNRVFEYKSRYDASSIRTIKADEHFLDKH